MPYISSKQVSGPGITKPGQLGVSVRSFGNSERPREYLLPGIPVPQELGCFGQKLSRKSSLRVADAFGSYRGYLQQVVDTITRDGEYSSVTIQFQEHDEETGTPQGLYIHTDPWGKERPWSMMSGVIEPTLQALIRSALGLAGETEIPIRRFVQFQMTVDHGLNWGIWFTPFVWCEAGSFGTHETYRW